jgi:hypothetical protein
LFTDAELSQLAAMAAERSVPLGTLLHDIAKRSLKRQRCGAATVKDSGQGSTGRVS